MEAKNANKMKRLKKLTKMNLALSKPPVVNQLIVPDKELGVTKAIEKLGTRADRRPSDAGKFKESLLNNFQEKTERRPSDSLS
jgi:hypothetical protein